MWLMFVCPLLLRAGRLLALVAFLPLVFDPPPQLLHVRIHSEEAVTSTCLCVVHLVITEQGTVDRGVLFSSRDPSVMELMCKHH